MQLALLRRFSMFAHRNARILSLASGLVMVSVWTVFRSLTNGVNFDVVGQIGMVQQWSSGMHDGATIGSTNYIIKMPLYWLVNHLAFLGPHGRLLAAALICNLITYAAIFFIFERILSLYGTKDKTWFYVGFLWVAAIAGNVYWLDYANSRNFETVGGLLWLYWALRYMQTGARSTIVLAAGLGGLIFFADPLQLFVIALPVCLFVFAQALIRRSRTSRATAAFIVGATLLGYGLSKILFWLATKLLPLSFLHLPGTAPTLSLAYMTRSFRGTLVSTLDVFGADFFKHPLGPNTVREFIGFVVLLGIVFLIIKVALKRPTGTPLALCITLFVTNYAVYIGTGQALAWQTSRYLVMLPLVAVLLVSIAAPHIGSSVNLKRLGLTASVLCFLVVCGALVHDWPTRYSKDAFITTVSTFLQAQRYDIAVAPRAMAIPVSYFTDYQPVLIPVFCGNDHKLHFSNLFFDQAPIKRLHSGGEVPIILPSSGVTSDDAHCSADDILAQLGQPAQKLPVPDIGEADLYAGSQLHLTQ